MNNRISRLLVICPRAVSLALPPEGSLITYKINSRPGVRRGYYEIKLLFYVMLQVESHFSFLSRQVAGEGKKRQRNTPVPRIANDNTTLPKVKIALCVFHPSVFRSQRPPISIVCTLIFNELINWRSLDNLESWTHRAKTTWKSSRGRSYKKQTRLSGNLKNFRFRFPFLKMHFFTLHFKVKLRARLCTI